MSKQLEDHVVEIDGVKYVPFDVALKIAQNNYTSTVNTLTDEINRAMSQYSNELKKLTSDDQDSA